MKRLMKSVFKIEIVSHCVWFTRCGEWYRARVGENVISSNTKGLQSRIERLYIHLLAWSLFF